MTCRDPCHDHHVLAWRGTRIEIEYCSDYSAAFREVYAKPLAHLTLRSVAPPNQPLPLTSTGYLSHFTTPDVISTAGGPVAFVRAALDEAAETDAWREQEAAARQYALF